MACTMLVWDTNVALTTHRVHGPLARTERRVGQLGTQITDLGINGAANMKWNQSGFPAVVIGLIGLAISITANRFGVSQKWDVGLGISFCVFGIVAIQFPAYFSRPSYWLILGGLLVPHFLALRFVLDIILRRTNRIPVMWSSVLAFAEMFALFVLMTIVRHRCLSCKKGKTNLSWRV